MVLAISLLAVLGFLIVPLAMGTRGQQLRPVRLLYFVAVGLGYILVEIAFIQRFVLFLVTRLCVEVVVFPAHAFKWHGQHGVPPVAR